MSLAQRQPRPLRRQRHIVGGGSQSRKQPGPRKPQAARRMPVAGQRRQATRAVTLPAAETTGVESVGPLGPTPDESYQSVESGPANGSSETSLFVTRRRLWNRLRARGSRTWTRIGRLIRSGTTPTSVVLAMLAAALGVGGFLLLPDTGVP